MSLELLATLESKIQTTLETIELLNLELDEERQSNVNLQAEIDSVKEENTKLQSERQAWNDKVAGLVDLLREETANTSGGSNEE